MGGMGKKLTVDGPMNNEINRKTQCIVISGGSRGGSGVRSNPLNAPPPPFLNSI